MKVVGNISWRILIKYFVVVDGDIKFYLIDIFFSAKMYEVFLYRVYKL